MKKGSFFLPRVMLAKSSCRNEKYGEGVDSWRYIRSQSIPVMN